MNPPTSPSPLAPPRRAVAPAAMPPLKAPAAAPVLDSAAPAAAPVVAVYAERQLTRAGLAALLRGHEVEVTAALADAAAAGAGALRRRAADVLLIATATPDPELTARLAEQHLAPVLLLLDRPLGRKSPATLGASGAVCRECPPEQLVEAIHALAAGSSFFECASHRAAGAAPALLSARERRVTAELARGAQTEEIAATLCISPHTARTHVRNIRRKLGARTSAQAVAVAISAGLVAPPAPQNSSAPPLRSRS